MDRSYRIRTDVGSDKVLRVNMQQNVDLFEVLSLKLSQTNMYRLHTSDYGIIVGRVLANDAFGIPNAKVSVFIPISEEDKLRSVIREMYPYESVSDVNSENVRYNTLPNYKKNDCHVPVGILPNKRLVLDDDNVLEIFDKYYKFTTTTNKSGDYMLFGIPTGNQVIHVDIDLSDIGVLSQKPRDFIYKGYSIEMFESPVQFKKSTNLDELPQIHSESASVTVYPFWGDKNYSEIAITRKDIKIQYEFTPTCVFIGSVMTDNGQNSISHNCVPDEGVGEAGQLVPSEGTIEMIRKTPYDSVEEFSIKGNQLIDDNGVWCYQIPMNLDFVGMDEYGNIVPTENPLKGIPTRSRVRFRFTLNETGDETLTRHCAKFLVPNNPSVDSHSSQGALVNKPVIDMRTYNSDAYYQFGTNTPEDCFRDLYWNKVYSVKSYIPRLQVSKKEKTANYFGIKGVNKKDARNNNIIPFNKININNKANTFQLIQFLINSKNLSLIKEGWKYIMSKSADYSLDSVLETFIEETDGVSLDFFNDWLNGCLYFPMWFWRIRKKKKYRKGEAIYNSQFCACKGSEEDKSSKNSKLKIFDNYAIGYESTEMRLAAGKSAENLSKYYKHYRDKKNSQNKDIILWNGITYWENLDGGIIKKMVNKDGADVYYYSAGNITSLMASESPYARLFATDIILLGSLNDCDIDGVPMMSMKLPSTTANIPPMGRINSEEDEETITPNEEEDENNNTGDGTRDSRGRSGGRVETDTDNYEDDDESEKDSTYNGMNWGLYWNFEKIKKNKSDAQHPTVLGNGLFFGITPFTLTRIGLITDVKTPINAERICELGVTLDADSSVDVNDGKYRVNFKMDGLITKSEIEDLDSRALFASLNMHKLIGTVPNNGTGYKTYNLTFMYPTNFDGRLEYTASAYTTTSNSDITTTDDRNKDYIDFRLGINDADNVTSYVSTVHDRMLTHGAGTSTYTWTGGKESYRIRTKGDKIVQNEVKDGNKAHFYRTPSMTFRESNRNFAFPLYENSFYFFFGLKKGSTAIDLLHKYFFSECVSDEKDAFGMTTDWDYCLEGESAATITINLINVGTPYTVIVDGDTKTTVGYGDTYEISGLTNGEHVVTVIDSYGNSVTEKVTITYPKISLTYNVLSSIATEYNENADEICQNGYSGKLEFSGFKAYGCEYKITSWDSGSGVVQYTPLTSDCKHPLNGRSVTVKPITPNFNADYLCDTDNNVLLIKKPETLTFVISETDYPEDSSTQRITITDTRELEMYINGVPLKHIVGASKDIPEKYNSKFRNPNGTPYSSCQSDSNLVGWFGLHDPKTYILPTPSANTFIYDTTIDEDWVKIRNFDIWRTDDTIDLVDARLKYIFDLCKNAYITNDGYKKTFSVTLDGGNSVNVLRSSVPDYKALSANNTERQNQFASYITSSNVGYETASSLTTPNIVSYNYRYSNGDGFPLDGANMVNGNTPLIDGNFDFNPKYNSKEKTAGNYFAGFSNNANLSKGEAGNCTKITTANDFQRLPAKSHDLAEDLGLGYCYDYEGSDVAPTPPVNGNNPYFRTEFIDRRLDYDMLYITPYDTTDGETEGTWSLGRVSGVTYNGIEMLYDDSADKVILSTGDNTEYKYNPTKSLIELKNDKPKRFFESTLKYGDGKVMDLRQSYHSNLNSPQPPIMNNEDGEPQVISDGHEKIGNIVCNNFGLNGTTVEGYPTVRYLDMHSVPCNDYYEYKTVSCSYNGINMRQTNDSITAFAAPGETVSFKIETGDLVSPVIPDFRSAYSQDKYNVKYLYSGSNLKSDKFNLDFHIVSNGSDGFRTKIPNQGNNNELGLRLVGDDNDRHSNLEKIKTATTLSTIQNTITSNTIKKLNTPDEKYDTDTVFKNYTFSFNNEDVSDYTSAAIIFDRRYFSTAADSLMKRLRVINASTVYNLDDIGFSWGGRTEWKYDMDTVVDADTVNVEVDVSGEVDTESGGTGTFDGSGTGGATQDPSGKTSEKHDIVTFNLSSEYVAKNFQDACFRIVFGGDTVYYDVGSMEITNSGTGMTFKIPMLRHRKLLVDGGTANVRAYIKVRNGLIYRFAFNMTSGGISSSND